MRLHWLPWNKNSKDRDILTLKSVYLQILTQRYNFLEVLYPDRVMGLKANGRFAFHPRIHYSWFTCFAHGAQWSKLTHIKDIFGNLSVCPGYSKRGHILKWEQRNQTVEKWVLKLKYGRRNLLTGLAHYCVNSFVQHLYILKYRAFINTFLQDKSASTLGNRWLPV